MSPVVDSIQKNDIFQIVSADASKESACCYLDVFMLNMIMMKYVSLISTIKLSCQL